MEEPRRRSWKGPFGLFAALALSFAWGALTYRELGTPGRVGDSPLIASSALAGSEAPPQWVGDFADAFCTADAEHIAARIGPPLDGKTVEIQEALATREWSCVDTRYLGGGANDKGEFYAWITVDAGGREQWWIFTVMNEKVVAIE